MRKSLTLAVAALTFASAGACSSSNDDTVLGSSHGGTGGDADASVEGSSNGGTNQAGNGGARTGGSSSKGGASQVGSGGASSGGITSAGGTPSSGGGASSTTGGAGTATPDAGTHGLCGSDPCTPTRCAGIGCGPAVCCRGPNGPVCIHGAEECPAPDGGVVTETLACWSRTGSSDFAKSCIADRDCFVAAHWTGCCRIEAIGLNAAENDAFTAFETTCGGAPACGCCCDTTVAEDGKTVPPGTTAIVACVSGACTTQAP